LLLSSFFRADKRCKEFLPKKEYSKTATTLEEMTKLIEQGFEYVTDTKIGETTYKVFRKKKAWRPE